MDSQRTSSEKGFIRRLMIFFGLVYFMQGIGQMTGLINQPLNYYFLKVLGFAEDQTTEYLAILTLPWVIKPLYGLVSDFIPIFGYRRKSYLFIMNLLAAGGFLWLTHLTAPAQIVTALLLTCFGTAASDVITDALMVEYGQRYSLTGEFQSSQWMWFNVAAIGTGFAGGWLTQHLEPGTALHTAALIALVAPCSVMLGTWLFIKEDKTELNQGQFKGTASSIWAALKSKQLWLVAFFIAFWQFSPGFGTPLYYYMTNTLKFEQDFIGYMNVVSSIGSVVGAILYARWLKPNFSTKTMVNVSIFLGAVSTLAYLWLVDPQSWTITHFGAPTTAMVLSFATSITSVVAMLTVLKLAADACPKQAEGFTFAALMSVYNFAAQFAAIIGARLFVHYFDRNFPPLIWVSAIATALCFFIVPLLNLKQYDQADDSNQPGASK